MTTTTDAPEASGNNKQNLDVEVINETGGASRNGSRSVTANEHAPSSVVIGADTARQSIISLQVLQDVYNELTGKTEEMSRFYDEPFQFLLNDYCQLNHRITQTCEQYCIKESNCSITLYHVDDSHETFSSFERFKAFNSGSNSATESVVLTYNFLVVLPQLNRPQTYKLMIRTASRVVVEKRMREAMPFDIPKAFKIMRGRTALAQIDYVDHVVARNLLHVVDEWFKTVRRSPKYPAWNFIARRTEAIPAVAKYVAGLIVAISLYQALPSIVSSQATLAHFSQVALASAVGLFAAYRVAFHLGHLAEDYLDGWTELSFISLTVGDETEIEEARAKNKKTLVYGFLNFAAAILASIIATLIVGYFNPD